MARRVTLSQLKSNVRQAQQKRRQAIDKYNREVRAYNQKVKQAINKYNREVNTYNARVRADRQRLRNELARLGRQAATARFVTFRTSFNVVLTAYERLEQAAIGSRFDARHNEILDLAERETANNAGLLNAILGDSEPASQAPANPSDSPLTPILHAISVDFSDRWRGALFSLNLLNPDAARLGEDGAVAAGHGGGGGDRGEQPAGLGDGDLRGLALDRPVALAAHRQRRVEQDGVAATRASKKCRRAARCSLREGIERFSARRWSKYWPTSIGAMRSSVRPRCSQ